MKGNTIAASCIFHDVTLGDNDPPCINSQSADCYQPSGIFGVQSGSTKAYAPTYFARAGWDFASGLGSVKRSGNLVNHSTGREFPHDWPLRAAWCAPIQTCGRRRGNVR